MTKDNKRKTNIKGFTMAEVLIAVAIIIILCSLVFIGLGKYQKNLSKLELDKTAQDIFVTAQNHLSAAKAQKYLGQTDFGREEADGTGIYYFILPRDAASDVYKQILPDGAIDASVLAQGNLLIRYDKNEGKILDVFYSLTQTFSDSFDYDALAADASVGHYGGVVSSTDNKITIATPRIEINNGDILEAVVYPNNTDADIKLTLVITGAESNKSHEITLYENKDGAVLSSEYRQLLDSVPEADGKTANAKHFSDLFADLTPGENLKIKAVVTKDSQVAESATFTANSLFASLKDNIIAISSFRHLENLNNELSSVDETWLSTKSVLQKTDLDWKKWIDNTGFFIPVTLSQAIEYNGSNLSIENVKISTDGNAGIFATLAGGSVSNLEIVNINAITSSGNAGALAGESNKTDITGVFVHNTVNDNNLKVSGTNAAGGLVGYFSAGNIEACTASVYINSGSYAGGLVGHADGSVDILNCYAGGHTKNGAYQTASTDKGRVNVLAGGYAGGLVGRGSIGLTVENSYSTCSAKYTAASGYAKGLIGNGTGTVSNCYSLGKMFDKSDRDITPIATVAKLTAGKATAVPYDDIVTKVSQGKYDYKTVEQLSGAGYSDYAFLGIHYGDWPVSDGLVNAYRNSDDAVAEAVKYITVQTGCGKSFFADLVADGKFKNSQVVVKGKSDNISSVDAETDLVDGKTKITVTAGTNVGVGYVDLEAEGAKLRLVVIIHDRKVTLTGTRNNATSADVKNASSRAGNGTYEIYGYVKLAPATDKKSGTLTGAVSSYGAVNNTLSADAVKTQLNELVSSSGVMLLSIDNAAVNDIYSNWNKIKNGEPSYSDDTRGILESSTLSGNVLSFMGKNSGTLPVYAHWAVDEDLYARSDIKMGGARAMIKTVAYQKKQIGPEYPYSIDIEPTAGELVKLDLKPILYNATKDVNENGTYKWEVYKGNSTTPIASQTKTTKYPNTAITSFVLDSDTGVLVEQYRIVLSFSYEKNGEKQSSVDEVLVNIYRKSSRGDNNYGQISIKSIEGGENGHSTWQTPSSIIYLEQVESGNGYTGWNRAKLSAKVDGIVNPQVKWSIAYAANGPWIGLPDVAGIPVMITGADSVKRGELTRRLDDTSPSGSYIEIKADDLGDYETELVFWLKTEAVDVVEGEDEVSSRTVEVHIMPKLRIPSSLRTQSAWYGRGSTNIQTNRTEAVYQYNWTAKYTISSENPGNDDKRRSIVSPSDGSTSVRIRESQGMQSLSGHTAAYSSLKVQHDSDVEYQYVFIFPVPAEVHYASGTTDLELSYGPYKVSAAYTTKGVAQETSANINSSGIYDDIPYYLVEAGKNSTLDFAWSSTYPRYASKVTSKLQGSSTVKTTSYSVPCTDNVTINASGTFSQGTSSSNDAADVSWKYIITGNSDANSQTVQPVTVTWDMKFDGYSSYIGSIPADTASSSFNFFVYGLNLKNGGRSVSESSTEVLTLGSTATWTAEAFFPEQLSPENQRIEWSVNNPDAISITSSADGKSVNITANKYAKENSLYITCTYTVHCGNNGEDYKCVKAIPVNVAGSVFDLNIEPCTAEDKEVLGALFFGSSDALSERAWIGQSSYLNNGETVNHWPLIENYTSYDDQSGRFRADEIFLKVSAVSGNPSFEQYDFDINSDAYYVDVESKLNKASNADIIYIRVAANKDTAGTRPIDLTLNISIGNNQAAVPIDYYKAPVVEIAYAPDDASTATAATNPIEYLTAYNADADIYGTFTAIISPNLFVNGKPLDSLDWSLSAPNSEYQVDEYAFLVAQKDGSEYVSLYTMVVDDNDKSVVPDFKVVVNAKSHLASDDTALSRDSYALVFLPEPNDSGAEPPYEYVETYGAVTISKITVKATRLWIDIVESAEQSGDNTTCISKGTVFSQDGVVYVAYQDITATKMKGHTESPDGITGIKKLTGSSEAPSYTKYQLVKLSAGDLIEYNSNLYIDVSGNNSLKYLSTLISDGNLIKIN